MLSNCHCHFVKLKNIPTTPPYTTLFEHSDLKMTKWQTTNDNISIFLSYKDHEIDVCVSFIQKLDVILQSRYTTTKQKTLNYETWRIKIPRISYLPDCIRLYLRPIANFRRPRKGLTSAQRRCRRQAYRPELCPHGAAIQHFGARNLRKWRIFQRQFLNKWSENAN